RIGGAPRHRLAALDAVTGRATAWYPGADSTVRALVVGDSTVYVGGSFSSAGGQPRNRIAALDRATGGAIDWDPDAGGRPRPDVYALALGGSSLYVGGDFTVIGGALRVDLAALDLK